MNVHSHLRDTYGAWQAFNSQLLRDLGGARTENPYEVRAPLHGIFLHPSTRGVLPVYFA